MSSNPFNSASAPTVPSGTSNGGQQKELKTTDKTTHKTAHKITNKRDKQDYLPNRNMSWHNPESRRLKRSRSSTSAASSSSKASTSTSVAHRAYVDGASSTPPSKRPKKCPSRPPSAREIFGSIDESQFPNRVLTREKQVSYGKNTLSYDAYRETVPLEDRKISDPWTPDAKANIPNKRWLGMVKAWRKGLHRFDGGGQQGADTQVGGDKGEEGRKGVGWRGGERKE